MRKQLGSTRHHQQQELRFLGTQGSVSSAISLGFQGLHGQCRRHCACSEDLTQLQTIECIQRSTLHLRCLQVLFCPEHHRQRCISEAVSAALGPPHTSHASRTASCPAVQLQVQGILQRCILVSKAAESTQNIPAKNRRF